MKTAVITGATGFIGTALSKELLKTGFKVYGIGRNEQKLSELTSCGDFTPIPLDFSQYSNLSAILKNIHIDCFYHLAWLAGGTYSSDIDVQLANIKASCDVMNIACELDVKQFIMAGSYYEFKLSPPVADNTVKKYDSIFGISKTCASEVCRNLAFQYGIPYVSVYIPKIFGPGDKPSSAPVKIVKSLIANAPVNLIYGEHLDDWVYIDDLVRGLISVAACKSGRYYIGNRNWKLFRNIMKEMKDILNSSSQLLFGEYQDLSFIDYSKMELDALYNATGFECMSDFSDSVLRLAEWIKTTNLTE
ncbi:MAG: NAD(P)-dependent oxidoreductase [Oscillospiraceae bacterium]